MSRSNPESPLSLEELILFHKTLADGTRLRLAHLLLRHELSVAELTAVLQSSQPKISRHLKVLAESGLARCRRDGLWAFYSAAVGRLPRMLQALSGMAAAPEFADDERRAAEVLAERAAATRRFFNEVAHDWPRLSREILGGLDLSQAVDQRLDRRRTIADLGCGPGALLPVLAAKAEHVIGVDSSARMLEEALRRHGGLPGLSLRLGELERLPLRDGEADAAVMSLVLHHLADPLAGLRQARRVLAPGGLLVLAELDRHQDESLRIAHADRYLGFSLEEIGAWLGQSGFCQDAAETLELSRGHKLHFLTAHVKN